MNYSYQEIDALLEMYENEEHLSEAQILQRCLDLISECEMDRETMFIINDAIKYHGYSFQFNIPPLVREPFDKITYNQLVYQTSKSLTRTKDLFEYLKKVGDYRLTFASLHAFKFKNLMDLNNFTCEEQVYESLADKGLKDVFFLVYKNSNFNEDVKKEVFSYLNQMNGENRLELDYMRFRYDCEYLFYLMELSGPKGYLMANTIKVVFNITPAEYLQRREKNYYLEVDKDTLKKYLNKLDKIELAKLIEEWKDRLDLLDNTGYKALILTMGGNKK